MLILFDVDMTLIRSGGVGMRSIEAAGQEIFGAAFSAEGIDFGGRLDPLIIADMIAAAGADPAPEHIAAVRAGYYKHIERNLASGGVAEALAGVHNLLAALESAHPTPVLGLLTGNFEETGRLKLAAAGLDADRFPIRVWGDESPHDPPARSHLPPIGIERASTMLGRSLDPAEVTIVGDTQNDVSCAKAHGCRALAVATGFVAADDLAAAGADRVAEDLTDTEDLVRWLVAPIPAS